MAPLLETSVLFVDLDILDNLWPSHPHPQPRIFKLTKFKLKYWNGHFQDAMSTLSRTLPLLSMTVQTRGRCSLVHFLPDTGQGVGGSFRAGGGDLHGSLWGREGVLIRLGIVWRKFNTDFFIGETCCSGTLWKEETFSCSMIRNIMYSFIGLSVSRAPTQTCQPSFYLASITSLG